jgi:hypothetical protein
MVSTAFLAAGLTLAVNDLVFQIGISEEGRARTLDFLVERYSDRWPRLENAINFDGFEKLDRPVGLSYAAALCRYLLVAYPLDQFRQFYTSVSENRSARRNVAELTAIYGQPVNQLVKAARQAAILEI